MWVDFVGTGSMCCCQMWNFFVKTLLIGWLTLFTIACSPQVGDTVREVDEKQYQLAQSYKAQGRIEEALSAFVRVIDARLDAAESHLEAGNIYLQSLKDPVRAIYHFDRFLQLNPKSAQAKQVRQLTESAQKEFVRQLPAEPFQGGLDRIDLMDLIEHLKKENATLKQDLARAQQGLAALKSLGVEAMTASSRGSPSSAQQTSSQNSSNGPQMHTVQSGDTLSTISQRYYGTPSRYMDVYQANRDRLKTANALKIGQQLRIP
mgnify:CR=1 FL=1